MLRIEPFKPEHIEAIQGRESVEKKWYGVGATPAVMAHFCEEEQPAWTAFDGEKILGCAGVYAFWQGVGEAWVFLNGELTDHHKIWFHKTVRERLWHVIEQYGFRRVQCKVEKGFAMGIKWIEMLGFKAESEMPEFGPRGETYIQYVILSGR